MRNEIIVKFRPQALHLRLLCYEYPAPFLNKEKGDKPLNSLPEWLRWALTKQRFYVDDLIADSSLLRTIKSFGGDTLRRITFANPCVDTLSLSRNRDTLKVDDYLWMVLILDNDTSVVNCCYTLLYYHFNLIELAQPNYLLVLNKIPFDNYFEEQNQWDFGATGIERAWDFTTGDEGVYVGIIDDGIDWRHCEFRTPSISMKRKIAFGWTWEPSDENKYFQDPQGALYGWGDGTGAHGTKTAGIIGALRNRHCPTGSSGMAGISGGWGDLNNPDIGPIGSKLFVYRILTPDGKIAEDKVIGSIYELSGKSLYSERGEGVHIINLPLSFPQPVYDQAMLCAIDYAYKHRVSVICARGNGNNEDKESLLSENHPATESPENWLICVGGSNVDPTQNNYKYKANTSKCSKNMDFIAPGAARWTTALNNGYLSFGGTSAATAHTSGIVSLLRSYAKEQNWSNLEPEDFEGMLKSSCSDISTQNPDERDLFRNEYRSFYDAPSGWGHLQANQLFEMLAKGYRITHYKIDIYDWQNRKRRQLNSKEATFIFYKGLMAPRDYLNVETETYKGNVYFWESEYTLPLDKWRIDDQNKLYIWGRSGDRPGGYLEPKRVSSNVNVYSPCFWTGYTKILSGYGGNDFVDGIIHDHSLTVKFGTYQYEVAKRGESLLKQYPEFNELCAYFTVFGLETPPSLVEDRKVITNKNQKIFLIFDNEHNATLYFWLDQSEEVSIKIYNLLGEEILDLGKKTFFYGLNVVNFETKNFANGVYFVLLQLKNLTQAISFVKIQE